MLFKEEEEDSKSNITIQSIDFRAIEPQPKSRAEDASSELSQTINDYLENSVDYLKLSTLHEEIPHPISLEAIRQSINEDKIDLDESLFSNSMIHVQLPKILPMLDKESTISASRGEGITQHKSLKKRDASDYNYVSSKVDELPSGRLGKLKIYRNGTKKLDIGGTLYDVTEGAKSTSLQKFACYLPETEEFILLNACDRRLTVSVDVNSMLCQSEQ